MKPYLLDWPEFLYANEDPFIVRNCNNRVIDFTATCFERRIVAQGQGEVSTSDSVMYTLLPAVLSGGGITVAGSFLATYMNNKHNLEAMN